MRNHPLSLPFWICVSMDRGCTQEEIGVLFMALLKSGLQSRMDIRVCGETRKITEGQILRPVEGDAYRETRRCVRNWGVVETTCGLTIVVISTGVFLSLLLQLAHLLYIFGAILVAVVIGHFADRLSTPIE